jgi:predicted kinase
VHGHLSDEGVDDLTINTIEDCIRNEESFIIDSNNINSQSRKQLIDRCKQQGYIIYGYDFGKGNIISLLRRKRFPRQPTEVYWEEVYNSNKKSFETPEPAEGFDRIYFPPSYS